MDFSFDEEKRRLTLEKRGLDFADATDVFLGHHVTIEDDRQDYGEQRFNTFGFLHGRAVIVTWTPRADGIRIISLRKANDREQARYRRILGGS